MFAVLLQTQTHGVFTVSGELYQSACHGDERGTTVKQQSRQLRLAAE